MRAREIGSFGSGAMKNEPLQADVGPADGNKVWVLGCEGLDELVTEQFRFPNADFLLDRAWQSI